MIRKSLRTTASICLIVGALSLTACCHNPVQADPVIDTGCVAFSAIRPTEQDIAVMSDQLVDQLLVHNEVGSKRCGWLPHEAPAKPKVPP